MHMLLSEVRALTEAAWAGEEDVLARPQPVGLRFFRLYLLTFW